MSAAIVRESKLRPIAVTVPGHKHAAVCVISAAVAAGCRMEIDNVPDIEDTRVLTQVVTELGGAIEHGDRLVVDTRDLNLSAIPPDMSTRVHGTLYLVPALMARFGSVEFPGAGGCLLERDGTNFYRPDAHIFSVLEKFGANFERRGNCVIGRSPGLRACDVNIMEYSENPNYFLGPLCTGATKTAILAALGVKNGTTRILNAIRRPEISALLDAVRDLGFHVTEGPGCTEITPNTLKASTQHRVLPDLSAIITYVTCAAYHGVPLHIRDVPVEPAKEWLSEEFALLARMGIELRWTGTDLHMRAAENFAPFDLEVVPEGFATDHQPYFALLALKARSESVIRDRVWPNRFQYADELRKLGASIMDIPQGIVIRPGHLTRSGQTVLGTDLRAATILLLAALGVPGSTQLQGLEHLDRGYEDIIGSLRKHGALIAWDGQNRAASSSMDVPAV